jgi:hypothetical protein
LPQPSPHRTAVSGAIGPRGWRASRALGFTLFLGLAGVQPGMPLALPARATGGPTDASGLLTVLRNSQTDRGARVDAARRLLDPGTTPLGPSLLADALQDPAADGSTKVLILEAIARSATATPALFDAVASVARNAGNEDLPLIAPALGALRLRDSARLLLDLAGPDRPASVRQVVLTALARLSGRDDLGPDRAAWEEWFDSVAFLSEADWQAHLAANHARRADRLARELDATRQELTPIYRRLYGQLPPPDRPGLLAYLLGDSREELRALGFQLAALELSAGGPLPQIVSDAAVALLADPSVQTRARAAVLIDQIATQESSTAILAALNKESEPEAAVALLAASARWPSPITRAAILRWLEQDESTRPAAAKAALALFRAGMLTNSDDRARAGAALRGADFDHLSTPELRLLVAIGSDDDRARVAGLLESGRPASRLAAAEALAGRQEFLPRLLAAAALDSDLFSIAADAVAAVGPTVESYGLVAALPAPDQPARTAGLLGIARRLSPSELLAVATATEDAEFAATLLDRLPDLVAAADPTTAGSVSQVIGLLARKRLELGQPDRALAALEALDTLRSNYPSLPAGEAADLRVVSYLCLDRLDRAVALGGSPEAWLDGLAACTEQPHARSIIAQIRLRFTDRLTRDQSMELSLLEVQVAAFEESERRRLVGPPAPEEPK